jgi:hypothetical protein
MVSTEQMNKSFLEEYNSQDTILKYPTETAGRYSYDAQMRVEVRKREMAPHVVADIRADGRSLPWHAAGDHVTTSHHARSVC